MNTLPVKYYSFNIRPYYIKTPICIIFGGYRWDAPECLTPILNLWAKIFLDKLDSIREHPFTFMQEEEPPVEPLFMRLWCFQDGYEIHDIPNYEAGTPLAEL